jgi:hypothetical protein
LVTESDEQYAIRRLGMAAIEIRCEGEFLSKTRLVKKAGVSQTMAKTIATEVERILNGEDFAVCASDQQWQDAAA